MVSERFQRRINQLLEEADERHGAQPPSAVPAQAGVNCARLLGDVAALLGDFTRARAYYQQAIGVCGRIRFRPEIALSHLGLAEVLLGQARRLGPLSLGERARVRARVSPPSYDRRLSSTWTLPSRSSGR